MIVNPGVRRFLAGQGRAVSQPSFSLPLTTSIVPSRAVGSATPTFTRASTAYVKDFEGLYKLCLSGESRFTGARRVQNGLTTTDLGNAGWTLSSGGTGTTPTRTVGQTDPWGGTMAVRLQFDRGASNTGSDFSRIVKPAGSTEDNPSIWLKSNDGNSYTINGLNASSSGAVTVTPVWKRFFRAQTGTTFQFGLFGGTGTAQAADILAAGPQCESLIGQSNQNPSEFVSVGALSTPYHGANVDGVKYFATQNGNTVTSNVVTEATGAAIATTTLLGYQAEGARSNLIGTTNALVRDMSSASWVATNVTKGTTTGIDGTATAAATLTASAGNGTVLYTPGLGSANRTYSFWAKRVTGSGTIQITEDGSTYTTITVTDTVNWTQYQIDSGSIVPVVGFKIVTNADAIAVDFNTLEANTFANPTPIPVNVSKAADVLTYVTTGNVNGATGSCYAEVFIPTLYNYSVILGTSDANNSFALLVDASGQIEMYDGTTNVTKAAAISSATAAKIASSWSGSTMGPFSNGVNRGTGAFDGNMSFGASFTVGGSGNGASFAAIKNLKIWPVALPAATLQGLTT